MQRTHELMTETARMNPRTVQQPDANAAVRHLAQQAAQIAAGRIGDARARFAHLCNEFGLVAE